MIPWQGALPPDPQYSLVLCTCHGAPQPLTPSATYVYTVSSWIVQLDRSIHVTQYSDNSATTSLHCLCMWVSVHLHHFPGVVGAYVAPDMDRNMLIIKPGPNPTNSSPL